MEKNDQKCDGFKTAEKMVKTNQDTIGEQCTRNDAVCWQSIMNTRK